MELLILILSLSFFVYFIYNRLDKIKSFLNWFSNQINNQNTPKETSSIDLSQKYSVILKYKIFVYVVMVLTTVSFIFTFKAIVDNPPTEEGLYSIMLIFFYFISMFSFYIVIKVIDFLFELDRTKSDR